MITVINAGGSGSRLWPLSTPDYPKHLLKLTGDRTMLQQTYDRATKIGNTIYVVTEASHSNHVKEQLPDLPDDAFLIEPGRRGTGNAIVRALDTISRKHDNNEPIAFVHSDHKVRDTAGYARSFKLAGESSQRTNKITLIGIEPTFPSTGFGYIETDGALDERETAFTIQSFKEKPDYETAVKYVEQGRYLWNCGYFVGSVKTFLDEIKQSSPELQRSYDSLHAIDDTESQAYKDAYLALDTLIIDYALSEKSSNLAVVPASFDWMDLGSFKDLYDAVSKDAAGNYLQGDNVHALDIENVFVRNDDASKPVAVIGLDNVVVVNTPHGILVARTDLSQKVGEVSKKLQA